MPNVEELLNQISTELKVQNEPLWISKLDLEYAYGQLELSEKTSKQCNFAFTGRNLNGCYINKRGFSILSDVPTIFLEKSPKH